MIPVMRFGNQGTPGSRFESALIGRPRGFFAAVAPLILAMGLVVWPFGGGHKVAMSAAAAVPSAQGTVTIGQDANKNTTFDVEVRHLAHPSALTPSAVVYVVWIQVSGHVPENQGALVVDDNLNGKFKGSTPYRQFSIFVTGEQSPQVRTPLGEQLLTAAVVR